MLVLLAAGRAREMPSSAAGNNQEDQERTTRSAERDGHRKQRHPKPPSNPRLQPVWPATKQRRCRPCCRWARVFDAKRKRKSRCDSSSAISITGTNPPRRCSRGLQKHRVAFGRATVQNVARPRARHTYAYKVDESLRDDPRRPKAGVNVLSVGADFPGPGMVNDSMKHLLIVREPLRGTAGFGWRTKGRPVVSLHIAHDATQRNGVRQSALSA